MQRAVIITVVIVYLVQVSGISLIHRTRGNHAYATMQMTSVWLVTVV